MEWQPVYATGWLFVVLWLIALGIMLWGTWLDTRRDGAVQRLAVGISLAVGSFKVLRLVAFFGLASVFLFAPAICLAYERHRSQRETGSVRVLRAGFFAAGSVMTIVALGIVRTNFEQLRLDGASMPEPQAVTMLAGQSAGGRVLVWFNWGEYAIWHLSPRMQVSIDGRRETVYSDRVQTRHFDFFFDRPGSATPTTRSPHAESTSIGGSRSRSAIPNKATRTTPAACPNPQVQPANQPRRPFSTASGATAARWSGPDRT
jgi:hypothetical protein